jgi:outer membrane protein W
MKKTIITTLICFIATAGFTQYHNLFGIGWEINFPNNGSYLTNTSYSGGKIEYRKFLKKDFSVGLAMNWTSFEQYFNRQTYNSKDGNNAVTSDFVAQVYTLPITATAHYYFTPGKLLKPYAGVGVGAQYMEQDLFYNVYETDEFNWGFVVRPEIGAIIQPDKFSGWGFNVAAGYSYATNKNGITKENKFQNFGITIGVVFGD